MSSPMAARRRLGVELRRMRETAGFSGEQAAAGFGWSQAKISRMESAVTRPTVRDVRDLLEFYQADPVLRDELLTLAAVAATRSSAWWNDYAGAISVRSRQRIALEADASTILHLAVSVIPGLLQTAEYAREIFSCTGVEETRRNIDLGVAARATRKEFVMRQPPNFPVVITDGALRWRPGSGEVQRNQLRSLLEEAATTPTLSIRVLPQYPRDGMLPLSDFMIYKFADPDVPVVAYVETPTGHTEIEKRTDIEFYEDSFNALLNLTLAEDESLEYIQELVDNIER
ncbi:MAG: helix-turn-helix domain-containing protein [Corynebacteriales bacterium]|nr:helix-turn-helix domain-containing protein [Mycobacteriales bacterium]